MRQGWTAKLFAFIRKLEKVFWILDANFTFKRLVFFCRALNWKAWIPPSGLQAQWVLIQQNGCEIWWRNSLIVSVVGLLGILCVWNQVHSWALWSRWTKMNGWLCCFLKSFENRSLMMVSTLSLSYSDEVLQSPPSASLRPNEYAKEDWSWRPTWQHDNSWIHVAKSIDIE